ncbi:hypothetical protein EHEL_090970 [Encephalitozoon hellem ATCC 50504]|uniref:CMP/dCMP-type deaminase domain-containing protein n=1 Tax=Encephalitozoon hellem TaxID=27973 RepID=A0A9Q9CBT7_ENCHE|nr:uncharacterized protein EHEL_090970 [Encephalitozoon hellem ATCC 50504]AFM98992.1 hypothetical protein EHEL_090970 [Encephalitozoon hellem ATCC 50504]UTX44008.1 hypothetical protein GPU96_09g17880 [Encephalitozoon hellem]|eukprot:XP_003887973.1 hypothetical protein EHEL_090970 [Encephalitozoon hellem ATCC 50504]
MFTRLGTPEEEREVCILKGYAIRTSRGDIKRFLRLMEYRMLPKHIKRIKQRHGDLLVLVDVVEDEDPIGDVMSLVMKMTKEGFGSELSSGDPTSLIETVSIPKYQPLTDVQYIESTALWPCIRSSKPTEELDAEYTKNMVREIISRRSTPICCGPCIIADGEKILSAHEDTDNVLGHSILKCVEEVSKAQISYLCTGLDAFIFREPCLSCSMAFVHGRIKRVFCINKVSEGPFSSLKINYNRSLNHRYPVYFMNEDCKDIQHIKDCGKGSSNK